MCVCCKLQMHHTFLHSARQSVLLINADFIILAGQLLVDAEELIAQHLNEIEAAEANGGACLLVWRCPGGMAHSSTPLVARDAMIRASGGKSPIHFCMREQASTSTQLFWALPPFVCCRQGRAMVLTRNSKCTSSSVLASSNTQKPSRSILCHS